MRNGRFGMSVLVDGRALPEHTKDGKTYVAAPAGKDFVIQITTPYGTRNEVVASVDGLSVMTGQDASSDERGYVLSQGSIEIPGFRLNDDEIAKFHFGDRHDSYAARIGKGRNVGVIAVKIFSEYQSPAAVYRPRGGFITKGGGDDMFLGGGATRGGGHESFGGGMKGMGGLGHDLGTEFGQVSEHHVTSTSFTRDQEVATLVIEYASEDKLVQAGIIVSSPLGAVDPFPADPKPRPITGCQPPYGWRR